MFSSQKYKTIPVFINARDLVSPLKMLISWLLEANYHNIYVLDNASSYPPLLDYYRTVRREVRIIPLGQNVGHTSLWSERVLERLNITGPFVYSDPDIVPVEECPTNVIEFFLDVLYTFKHVSKVGFGLVITDLPDHYKWKQQVIAWESQYWKRKVSAKVYDASLDTTFALYRPSAPYNLSGLRTGFPYLARHYPWYENSAQPTPEQLYYKSHVRSGISSWTGNALPGWFSSFQQCEPQRIKPSAASG